MINRATGDSNLHSCLCWTFLSFHCVPCVTDKQLPLN